MSTEEHVALLYPDTVQSAGEANTLLGASHAADDPTDDLYPTEEPASAGNPYSLDQGSLTDNLYGAEAKVELSEATDLSIIYGDAEDQAALSTNLGHIASELGATQTDIESIVEHVNRQLTIGAVPDAKESLNTLYEQHGPKLNAKLDAAHALVQSLPEIAAWLDSTGLGNDPIMINRFISLSETPRGHSRLQKLGTR